MLTTDMYEGMLAETVSLPGANGDLINAYLARPLGPGPYPGMVIVHHMPGSHTGGFTVATLRGRNVLRLRPDASTPARFLPKTHRRLRPATGGGVHT